MKHKYLIPLCCAVVLVQLSACSSIKELFPDKEKDYQFTTEIPKLIVPADLANGTNLNVASPTTPASSIEATAETTPAATESPSTEADKPPADDTATDEPPIESKAISVELLESTNKVSYLRIGVPFIRAWRIVSKGLSRKSIEVSDRNQADRIFTVQYDPDEKPIEDGSYLDELTFMLHGFQGDEKEYLLKLVENNQQTDVVILNEEQKPSSDEAGLKLLKVLEKSIKANLAGK